MGDLDYDVSITDANDTSSPEEEVNEDDYVVQRYNSQLPSSYQASLDVERRLYLRALRVLVDAILQSNEANGGDLSQSQKHSTGKQSSESLLNEDVIVAEGYENEFERDFAALEKGITRYLDLKHVLEPTDYPLFINVLLRGAMSHSIDMGLRAKLARAVTRLLQKRQCEVPHGFSWRPIMNTIIKYHIDSVKGGPFIGRDIRDAHCRNMLSLLTCSRNYLTANDSAEKIWNEFAPKLSPHVDIDSRFQDLLLLSHVLPTRGSSWSGWVTMGMQLWKSVEFSSDWDATWMCMMGRLAKHQPCAHDWTSHLPLIYSRLTNSFHLPLGAIAPQSPVDRRVPHFCMFLMDAKTIPAAASLIVNSLSPRHSEPFEYLERLFALLANYLHPSNTGRWSSTIGSFLVHVTANLSLRYIEERSATKAGVAERVISSKTQRAVAPLEHRLREEDIARLTNILLPLIQLSLQSKISSVSMQAASAARDLAIVSPQIVIEPFLVQASEGLESISSPHRTIAALRLLSTITSVFLDKTFFASGAEYLPQVMQLSLPGIDPNDIAKTEATLKFVSATAARLQSLVASDPNGSTAMFLEDYVHQFLDRIFSLLEGLEAPPKKGRNGFSGGGSQLSYFVFAISIDNIFAALPPNSVTSAAQRVARQISGAACMNAMKYYAVLARTAVAAVASSTDEATASGMFLPGLIDQLVERSGEDGSISSLEFISVGEEELVWRIRMLAQSCRNCGRGIMKYIEQIILIIGLAMKRSSRPIYKAGGRLLRGVLEGLTSTQMKFGPGRSSESDSVGDGEPYLFEWKVPTQEEWKEAERFLVSFVEVAECLVLGKNEDNTVITADRDALFRALRLLHAIQRGGRWLLAGALPDHFKVLAKYLDHGVDMSKADAKLALKLPTTAGLGGERDESKEFAIKLWTRVHTLILNIIKNVMTTRPDDGALLYRCLEPLELASEPFRRGNKSRQPIHTCRAYKAVYKPIVASKRVFGSEGGVGRGMPRFIVKLRIEAHHEVRLSLSARAGLCDNELFNSIVSQLTSLAVNDFPRVRFEARGVLTRSLRHSRPRVRRREICRVIELLEKSAAGVSAVSLGREEVERTNGVTPNATTTASNTDAQSTVIRKGAEKTGSKEGDILYDRMIGAAAVLRSSAAAPLIMRDWRLFSRMVKSLLDAMLAAERPDAAGAVGSLFAKLSSMVRPLSIDPLRLVGDDFTTVPNTPTSDGEIRESRQREELSNELNDYLLGMLDKATESLKTEDGKKEAHWRLQSLVATILYIVLREDRTPREAVAKFFINGLVSDVVTLRQIALKAIMFILAVHGRKTGTAHTDVVDDSPASWKSRNNIAVSSVGEVVCVKDFSRRLIHTLALDHEDDLDGARGRHAVFGMAGGAIAVMNLSRLFDGDACWMVAGGKPWPSSWIPRSRDTISIIRVRLYESFVRVFGRHALAALMPALKELIAKAEAKEEKIISGVKDEDVRVLSSEVLAGICRGLDIHQSDESSRKQIQELTISLLADMTGQNGNFTGGTLIRLIGTADAFTVGREIWKKVVDWLLEVKPIIVPMGDGPVAHLQARRLRYLHASMADTDNSKEELLKVFLQETLSALSSDVGFDHELKTVREEVARCLALIASNLPAECESEFAEHINMIRERMSTVDVMDIGEKSNVTNGMISSDQQLDDKRKSRSRQGETLSRFVSVVQWSGRSVNFMKYMPTLLPTLFESFDESDPERIMRARMALSFVAQGRYSSKAIDEIIASVEHSAKDSRWKVRSSVLAFLQVFSFASLFAANAESHHRIRGIVLSLLHDGQLEVRQASGAAFVSMIRDSTPAAIDEVRESCMGVLKQTTRKRGTRREPMDPETICKRHGAVLGLSSMITSSPYSVPKWMPSVLVALSTCVNDPPPISTGVRKLFADFMRTHRDEWQTHKQAFTPDELEIVSELLVSPSYYA